MIEAATIIKSLLLGGVLGLAITWCLQLLTAKRGIKKILAEIDEKPCTIDQDLHTIFHIVKQTNSYRNDLRHWIGIASDRELQIEKLQSNSSDLKEYITYWQKRSIHFGKKYANQHNVFKNDLNEIYSVMLECGMVSDQTELTATNGREIIVKAISDFAGRHFEMSKSIKEALELYSATE